MILEIREHGVFTPITSKIRRGLRFNGNIIRTPPGIRRAAGRASDRASRRAAGRECFGRVGRSSAGRVCARRACAG